MAKVKQKFSTPLLQLYDVNKNFVCNLTNRSIKNSAYSIKKHLVANDVKTLTFSIPFDNEFIHPNSCEYWVKHEFDWYIIKTITLSSTDVKYLEVTCEDEFTISKTVLCTPVELVGCSPLEMFEGIMNSIENNLLDYKFKGTDITETYRSLVVEDETSCFENLVSMAELFDAIIEMSTDAYGQKWIFLRRKPYERGKVVRKNYDITSMDLQYDTSSLFTRLMPFGEEDDSGYEIDIANSNPTGKLYIENYSYFLDMGMTKEEVLANPQCLPMIVKRYDNIFDSATLYETAVEDLKKICKPTVTGNIELCDLSVLEDNSMLEPLIYERIIITDPDLKMRYDSVIQEIEYDYDNILESKITLGSEINYSSTFKDLVTSSERADRVITRNPFDGKPTVIASTIRGKINSAIAQIGCMLDTIESPQAEYAILFEDRRVGSPLFGALAIGTSGILISRELDVDNTWKWSTAINSQGVNASEVVTGTLWAEIIKAGVLSDVEGTSWIDMETGSFSFANGAITFDKENGFKMMLNSETGEDFESAFKDFKDEINLEIKDVKDKVDNIGSEFNEYFRDGIIDEVEAKAIDSKLLELAKEKADVDTRYDIVYNNVNLIDPEKTNLRTAYSNFVTQYNALVSYTNTIISDGLATEGERNSFKVRLSTYNETLPVLTSAFEEAINCISVNIAKTQLSDFNNTIQQDISNVEQSVTNLENTMNGAFKDGIIDEAEYIAIKENINSLQLEREDIDKNYQNLSTNEFISKSVLSALTSAYNNYVSSHDTLIGYVEETIGDRIATDEERAHIEVLLDEYGVALADYGTAQTNAINDIASNNSSAIAEALKNELNSNIKDVSDRADALEEAMGDYTADGILTEAEKQNIRSLLKSLASEKADIDNEYNIIYANVDLIGTAKSNLKSAYDSYNDNYKYLVNLINNLLLKDTITDANKNSLNNAFVNHDNSLALYSKRVNEAIDSITAKKQQDAVNDAKEYYDTQIKIDKTGILTTVSKTYATKSELQSISIGMRNRALRTDVPASYTFSNANNQAFQPYVVKGDVSDTECMVIFDFTSTLSFPSSNSILKFQSQYVDTNGTTQWTPVYDITSLVKGRTKGTVSFSATWGSIKADTNTYVRFRGDYITGKFTVSNVRVVKGNTFCEWSQAPEDTFSYIDDAIYSMSDDLQTQIDGKIETYNQTTDPSSSWYTATAKESHTGDLWYNPSTQITKRWNGSSWVEQQGAEPLAMEKRRVFITIPTPPYDVGDLWVTSLDGGELKTCKTAKAKGQSYASSDWVAGLKYTDNSLAYQLQTELNNMSIGTRNLISNSAFLYNTTNWSFATNCTLDTTTTFNGHPSCKSAQRGLTYDDWRGCINYCLPKKPTSFAKGEILTYSCWYYITDKSTFDSDISLELKGKKSGSTSETGISSISVAVADLVVGRWTKIYKTVTLDSNWNEVCIRAYVRRNGTAWFTDFKLEKGNKVTDWTSAPEDTYTYTDDLVYDLQDQIDKKIQTYNQPNDPSTAWTAKDEKMKHKGDLWYNPSTAETKRYTGTRWELQPEAEKLAKTKSTVWHSTPTVPYYKGDLWILQSDTAHTAGKKGEILTCTTTRTYANYIASDWVKELVYTDDTYAKKVESHFEQRADSIEMSVTGLEEVTGVPVISNKHAMTLGNWTKSGTISLVTSTSSTINTMVLITATSTTGEAYAYVEGECARSTRYNFSMNYAPYSTTYPKYSIKLQQYLTNTGSWGDIRTWAGSSSATKSNMAHITHNFTTSAYATKLRVMICKVDGATTKLYVANLNIIGDGGTFATNASIKLMESKIQSKVSAGDAGTLIEQNPTAVKIAWNKVSNYVQFENGSLAIYNASVSSSQKRAVFDEDGNHFWRDGYYLGKIGTNSYVNDSTIKGIVFDLEYRAGYMTWAVKETSTANTYTMMWTYANKTTGNLTGGRLHAGCDIDMHNYRLRNVQFEGGGLTGTLNFVQVLSVNSNGTVTGWANGCRMEFQNGILIRGAWNG